MSQAAERQQDDRSGTSPAGSRPPARLFWLYRWAVGLAIVSLQSVVYFSIGHSDRPRSTTLLDTALDRSIPFLPWTVWWYLPFYAGIFVLAVAGLRSRRLFDRAAAGGAVYDGGGGGRPSAGGGRVPASAGATALPRSLAGVSGLGAGRSIRRATCSPRCTWPTPPRWRLILRHDRPRLGALAMVMAALLALSTLTTKQHFLADVVAGLAMGAVTSFLVLRRPDPTTPAAPPTHARS